MTESIEAYGGQHFFRHGLHQVGIDDRGSGDHRIIPQRFLIFRPIVCQNGKTVPFTSGSACSWNKDQRKSFFSGSLPVYIIKDRTLIAGSKSDGFAAVHDAATAQSDDDLDAGFLCDPCASHDRGSRRIGFGFVEYDHLCPCLFKQGLCTIQETGSFCTAPSCDNHNLLSVPGSLLSENFCFPGTEDQVYRKIILK